MDWIVVLIVLAAAFAHAAWNLFIKMGGDRLCATALMFFCTAIISTLYLIFSTTPLPSSDVWGYLMVSSVVHGIYVYSLSRAYDVGDFSKIYPIARGGAPLVSVLIALGLGIELLTSSQWMALCLILGGVLVLSKSKASLEFDQATLLALFIAVLIGLYTLLDGLGARLHGDAPAYIAWTFILYGYPFAVFALIRRKMVFIIMAQSQWYKALLAGLVSTLAYVMVTWAMTQAPIGLVAALRETSVLFGLVLAHFILHERFGLIRILATLIIVAGVTLLRL